MINLKPSEAFTVLATIDLSKTPEDVRQAIIEARVALYKQIPENVLHDSLCPNCKTVIQYGQKYCPACGKALKL